MSHGGKRTGAGRPRALRDIERLRVGSMCEWLYHDAQKSSVKDQIGCVTKAVRLEHEIASSVPVERRPEWTRSLEFEDHKDNIQFALQTAQKLNGDQPPSSVMLPPNHDRRTADHWGAPALPRKVSKKYSQGAGRDLGRL